MENTMQGIPQQMQGRSTKTELGDRDIKTGMGKIKTMEKSAEQLHASELQLQNQGTREYHSTCSTNRDLLEK